LNKNLAIILFLWQLIDLFYDETKTKNFITLSYQKKYIYTQWNNVNLFDNVKLWDG